MEQLQSRHLTGVGLSVMQSFLWAAALNTAALCSYDHANARITSDDLRKSVQLQAIPRWMAMSLTCWLVRARGQPALVFHPALEFPSDRAGPSTTIIDGDTAHQLHLDRRSAIPFPAFRR